MPLFTLSKQGFDPHAALAHGFLIRLGRMIGTDLFEVLLIKAAFEHTPLITGGALSLEGTRVTGRRVGLVAFLPLIVGMGVQRQDGIVGTHVDISLWIVAKRLLAIDGGPLVEIGQRNIGSYVLVLHRHNIVDGAVRGITRDLARPEFPAEAHTEGEVEHRLVFHHFRWGDQRGPDYARLAPINHVVRVEAEMASRLFGGHERRIRIGRADNKVCTPPITSTYALPLEASCLLNPIMPLLVGPGQVLTHGVFQTDRKLDGSGTSGFTERGNRHCGLTKWRCLFTDSLWRRGCSGTGGEGWLHMRSLLSLSFLFRGEESSQMLLDGQGRLDRIQEGVSCQLVSSPLE